MKVQLITLTVLVLAIVPELLLDFLFFEALALGITQLVKDYGATTKTAKRT